MGEREREREQIVGKSMRGRAHTQREGENLRLFIHEHAEVSPGTAAGLRILLSSSTKEYRSRQCHEWLIAGDLHSSYLLRVRLQELEKAMARPLQVERGKKLTRNASGLQRKWLEMLALS